MDRNFINKTATTMTHAKLTSSLSIKTRLIFGFSTIILILIVSAAITLFKVSTVKNVVGHFLNIDVPLYDSTADLYINLYRMQNGVNTTVKSQAKDYQLDISQAENNIDKIQSNINKYVKKLDDKSINASWENIKTNIDELQILNAKVLNMNNQNESNLLLENKINPLFNSILNILDGKMHKNGTREGGLLTTEYKNLEYRGAVVKNDVHIIAIAESILLFSGLIIALLIVYFTMHSIVRYINLIKEMTQLLDDASHNMVESLSEVRQAASMQSTGASEQASSINEITASLEEIEKSTNQTNEKAKALGDTAERSHIKGQQGLGAVAESISGMKTVRDKVQVIAQTILDLSNQTQQVGEITAVVNNLAQQLKMLALNASIEAVKAGETGKGFAIVATEVKNLAERSEQSTVQVQKILENIKHTTEKAVMVTEEGTKGVDLGTVLVEQTGEIVESLSNVINETSIATQQIEAAIRQESVGIQQITLGMNEINQVTSSFVASTRQTTDAVEHLFTIAKEIRDYIEVYTTDSKVQ